MKFKDELKRLERKWDNGEYKKGGLSESEELEAAFYSAYFVLYEDADGHRRTGLDRDTSMQASTTMVYTADKGFVLGQYVSAMTLMESNDSASQKKAMEWMQQAAAQGLEEAKNILGETPQSSGKRKSKKADKQDKENTDKPVFPPTVSRPVTSGANAESLTKRGFIFLEDSEWGNANLYFDSALDIDPEYAKAYVGKLCVKLQLGSEEELAECEHLLDNDADFKKAIRYADDVYRKALDEYNAAIKDRLNARIKADEEAACRKLVQDAFDSAEKIMNNAQNPDDYRKAITAFDSIDSNYQDINSNIKGKIAECEQKMQQMVAELDKVLAPLRERFDPEAKAEKQAQLQEQRKADEECLDAENAKTKADVEAKCAQIKQKYDDDYKTWQEECNRLEAAYDMEYKKWENEVQETRTQAESRKSQGLCPHCGGTLKGMLSKKCVSCGKTPSESLSISTAPAQPNYPAEPKMPQMPTYTPQVFDESKYTFKEDFDSRIMLAGIEWRILDARDGKLLLISEKILEVRPYNADDADVTWETCDLRQYLNNEFYNKLGVIKSAIAETRNDNPDNPWYGTAGGNATTDKVFLLSLDEVVKYFGDSGQLKNKPESDSEIIDDQYSSMRIAKDASGEVSWWWLRSPGEFSDEAAGVYGDCDLNICVISDYGVRPALWLNL
jgi:hypothetical protein